MVPADRLFKKETRPANAKAMQTDSASKIIIDTEDAQRRAKTERLRLARVAQIEATTPAEPAAKKPARVRAKKA